MTLKRRMKNSEGWNFCQGHGNYIALPSTDFHLRCLIEKWKEEDFLKNRQDSQMNNSKKHIKTKIYKINKELFFLHK